MATATATHSKMYIEGKWCAADNGRTLGVINPATEEVVAEVAYGGRPEARRAVLDPGEGWQARLQKILADA